LLKAMPESRLRNAGPHFEKIQQIAQVGVSITIELLRVNGDDRSEQKSAGAGGGVEVQSVIA
tara:strand:- start:6089 stop:6274 length:186 start_codon:yes stop_codon:yes gene_type:complete